MKLALRAGFSKVAEIRLCSHESGRSRFDFSPLENEALATSINSVRICMSPNWKTPSEDIFSP